MVLARSNVGGKHGNSDRGPSNGGGSSAISQDQLVRSGSFGNARSNLTVNVLHSGGSRAILDSRIIIVQELWGGAFCDLQRNLFVCGAFADHGIGNEECGGAGTRAVCGCVRYLVDVAVGGLGKTEERERGSCFHWPLSRVLSSNLFITAYSAKVLLFYLELLLTKICKIDQFCKNICKSYA